MANKDEVPLANRQQKVLLYLLTQIRFRLEKNVSRVGQGRGQGSRGREGGEKGLFFSLLPCLPLEKKNEKPDTQVMSTWVT